MGTGTGTNEIHAVGPCGPQAWTGPRADAAFRPGAYVKAVWLWIGGGSGLSGMSPPQFHP